MKEETTLIKKPKGKRSMPKAERPKYDSKKIYAYEIRDSQVGNLLVKNSPNAWWIDRAKVEKLMDAFKIGCLIQEARVYAGISRFQWEYFVDIHPEFSAIKEACEEVLVLKARQKVAQEIATNPSAAYAYLQKHEEKLAKRAEANKEAKPNAVVFVDFGEPLPLELQEANNDDNHAESE